MNPEEVSQGITSTEEDQDVKQNCYNIGNDVQENVDYDLDIVITPNISLMD